MAEPWLLDPGQNSIQGIGGWLVLPLIGLIVTPLRELVILVNDVLPFFEPQKWEVFTSPLSTLYSPWWTPYFVVSLIGCVGVAAWAVVLLVLFFGRKKQLPAVISIFYLAGILWAAFELVSVLMLTSELPQLDDGYLRTNALSRLIGTVAGAAIWIPYFFRSVRVRNTFVR
jgi:hypothetical protein